MDNTDELKRLAIFAHVVSEGGFSAASRRLGLSRSAVSKQVALLEERLGVQLLHRTTRTLKVTEAGQAVFAHARILVQEADAAVSAARDIQGVVRGTLRITAPLGLGEHFLAPKLADFLSRHPDLKVDISLSDEPVDLLTDRVDVALRAGRLRDSSLVARRLSNLDLVVCAAPAWLASQGRPTRPAELAEMAWIAFWPLGTPPSLEFGPGVGRVKLNAVVSTNNGGIIRQLLLACKGISALPRFYVADDLASGALEEVLPGFELKAGGIYLVFPPGILPPRTRAFVDYMTLDKGQP